MLMVLLLFSHACYLFLFVLLTRPSASALVFKIYWGNRDQRLVWTVEQVSRGWTQHVNRVWTQNT